MHPSLTLYSQEAKEYISTDFEISVLASDCLFTEGPVWNPSGYYLFSDITANCIYRIDESGTKQVYLANSGTDDVNDPYLKSDQAGSNGLGYDVNGDLLICRHGKHELARYNGHSLEAVVNRFDGNLLNSPNDLIVHSNGTVYFSDPPYGLKDGKLNPEVFQKHAGVYCYRQGTLQLICDRYQYPNGVCLSPDEALLYICSNKSFENFISVYDTISHRLVQVLEGENSDGIEIDRHGNLYLCSREGLIVLNREGKRLARIELPAIPANVCWGGKERRDVLITAREYVILIRGFRRQGVKNQN